MAKKFIPAQPVFSNRDLVHLIWPLLVDTLLAVLVGMADTMMVSSVGEAAVSGVSLVDQINVLLINLFSCLATGGAVVTAQLIGAGDRTRAATSATQLILSSVAISSVVTALVLSFQRPLLSFLFGSITEDVMQSCLTYLWITALSFPFLALYNAAAAVFRAQGNSRVSMYVSVLVNAVNVVGNALCVFGFRMGVAGVAVPTLVSRALGAVVLLLLLRNPQHTVTLYRARWRFDFVMIKRILRIAVPSGVEGTMFQLGRLLVVTIISTFGTAQIAANAVANNLDMLGAIPGQAMQLAVITVIGQCVGAGDIRQAKWYSKRLLALTYALGFVCNALIIACMPLLVPLYSVSPEATSLSYILIGIHNGMAILLWPAAFVLPNALRAASDVRFTMVVGVASMWVFRIGASYILGLWLQWGAIGVWVAMVLDWVCRSAFCVGRFASGKWLKKVPQKLPLSAE